MENIILGLGLGLGFRQTSNSRIRGSTSRGISSEVEKRELYRRIGLEYVSVEEEVRKGEEARRQKRLIENRKKYGKKYGKKYSPVEIMPIKEAKKSLEKPEHKTSRAKEDKQEESGGIKRTLKDTYFRLTSKILNAPGEVPPEILADHREKINEASVKLDDLINDLRKAGDIASDEMDKRIVSTDIDKIYRKVKKSASDEKKLNDLTIELNNKKAEILKNMRNNVSQTFKVDSFENELIKFAKANFKDMSKEEIDEEIQYVLLDSKIDENGKLVLPKRSIFQDVIFDKNGQINPKYQNVADAVSKGAEIKRLTTMSNEELLDLGKVLQDGFLEDGKDIEELKDKNSKSYKLLKFIKDNSQIVTDEDLDKFKTDIYMDYYDYQTTEEVSEEINITYKLLLSSQIRSQLDTIKGIIFGYDQMEKNGEKRFDRDARRKREMALKVARRKVDILEKAGLSKTINHGDEQSKDVMERAREILLPELKNARDKDIGKYKEVFGKKNKDHGERN